MGGKAGQGWDEVTGEKTRADAGGVCLSPLAQADSLMKRVKRDGALPAKYKCILSAAVCLAIGRYGLAEEEAAEALERGATGWELVEGLLSSSSGWRILH